MLEKFKVLSTTLGTIGRTILANLIGVGNMGDDETAERIEDSEVIYPLGIAARPSVSANTQAVIIRVANQVVCLAILDKSMEKYVTADLREGDLLLYGPGEPTATIRIRSSGKLELTAKSGQDVVVNNGILRVARHTDSVDRSEAMGIWMTAVGTALGIPDIPTDTFAEISNGADNFRA